MIAPLSLDRANHDQRRWLLLGASARDLREHNFIGRCSSSLEGELTRVEIGQIAISDLALIGFRPPFGSAHQYGIRPHFNRSSEHSPVLWFSRMTSSSWLGAPFQRRGLMR